MMQNKRDAQQQLGIQALFPEYFVHIRPVAIQLLREPRNRTLLTYQLLLYDFPYVYHKKEAEPFDLFQPEAPPSAL